MGHKLACWSCLSFVVVLSRWHRASADTHPFNLPAIRGPQRSLQQDTTADSMYLLTFSNMSQLSDVQSFCSSAEAISGSGCLHIYSTAVLGCAVVLTSSQLKQAQAEPKIVKVEQDYVVSLHQSEVYTQLDAPYQLDRLDQADLPLDGTYRYGLTGSGVNIYILDTGINKQHEQFQYSAADQALGLKGTRAKSGFSAYGDNNTDDCYGHGTHVAGIAGGLTFGDAKNSTLWAVRCIACNGNGAASAVIAGLDWVAANLQLPAVISMSLGATGVDTTMDAAVQAVLALGATVVVAAGNYNNDACQLSPAHLSGVIAVAASDDTDTRWPSSNYGSCVDLYAPGVDIVSAYYKTDTGTIKASGTSMSCPLVSGAVAQYLQLNPNASPNEVMVYIKGTGVSGVVQQALESLQTPNLLLQTPLTHVPDVIISPSSLEPVVLYEGSFSISDTQTILLNNTGNATVEYEVVATPNGLIGGWISAVPANGTIAPGKLANVTLQYDISDSSFQGVYAANVLITTNARPVATSLSASAYVFCAALQTATAAGTRNSATHFVLAQETRPTTIDWPAMADAGSYVYVDAVITFSHPVLALNSSAVVVNKGAGIVEGIAANGTSGVLCSQFVVRAKVPFNAWNSTSTTVCVSVDGTTVQDTFGDTFPATENCTTLNHRPHGRFFAPYMATAGDVGPTTDEQTAVALLVFSEPVTALTAASFSVSGPPSGAAVTGVKLLRGTSTYYHAAVSLPAAYYGQVTVALAGAVTDAGGRANVPVTPLVFTREAFPLMKGIGYQPIPSPGIQAVT